MNSTGRELSQADLIRNFVLMRLEPDTQTRLYEQYWRPMEIDFGQEAYTDYFDSFMRHYLIVKTGEIPNVREVYEAFKAHSRAPEVEKAGTETLIKEVREFARYFCAMVLAAEPDKELALAFQDLRELKVEVAYPRADVQERRRAKGLQFVNLVIDYLTQSGWMRSSQLYESPFTEFSPRGVEGVFNPGQVAQLLAVLDGIRNRAQA